MIFTSLDLLIFPIFREVSPKELVDSKEFVDSLWVTFGSRKFSLNPQPYHEDISPNGGLEPTYLGKIICLSNWE